MTEMIKKTILCLAVVVLLLGGCTANNGNSNPDSQQNSTPQTELQSDDVSGSTSMSEEEYALFQELQEENEFTRSQEYHEMQISSWKFARACLSNDTDSMETLVAADTEISTTKDIFYENLEFIILKGFRRSDDGQVTVSYEFQQKGEDSYSYLTIEMANVGGEWKVVSYGFEK